MPETKPPQDPKKNPAPPGADLDAAAAPKPPSPTAAGGDNVVPGTPESPRAPANIGSGAANTVTTDVDPNLELAREQARDTRDRKQEKGETPGEEPAKTVSIASRRPGAPSGPVGEGQKRVRVVSPIMVGGRAYEPGRIVDVSEEDFASLEGSVEEPG